MESGGSEIQGQLWLPSECQSRLGHLRPCMRTETKRRTNLYSVLGVWSGLTFFPSHVSSIFFLHGWESNSGPYACTLYPQVPAEIAFSLRADILKVKGMVYITAQEKSTPCTWESSGFKINHLCLISFPFPFSLAFPICPDLLGSCKERHKINLLPCHL